MCCSAEARSISTTQFMITTHLFLHYQLTWKEMTLDFSMVYRLSLTQNHPGNQNLLLLIHFHRSCVRHIYLLPYSLLQLHVFTSLLSHRKDV